ncbi:alpha/beta fold hydrolase [Pararhodobacter zhoushanensis]|uniref:Palmitoyl-protein thioesterase ABHD10, mitochondrial n=1 Tax=Pararhodobacter zhoushanensis TaxID=2479545 RepID=A0ABT3GYW4_9RHOB|nr:alpha/beta hydrolase [Pararhodobacter zhoushanensis]MCW1932655.1 alpha/beta hydrolase [Pararhodobacter zhoushanensis]
MTDFLTTQQGRRLAYVLTPGTGPTVVFLGGFKSDMTGTKAQFLEGWAKERGRAFLRFDYSGHGQSSEDFLDGAIGDWAQDAVAAITALATGPLVLVGSSMGGWISLLTAKAMPERIAALVGIAAAPDFTEDSMWASFDAPQRAALERDGHVALPSEYDGGPYIITRRLIEEGRSQLVLRDPLPLPFPVRLLQGSADVDVPQEVALRLFAHADSPDMTLTLVKGADHRFSNPENLSLLAETLDSLSL